MAKQQEKPKRTSTSVQISKTRKLSTDGKNNFKVTEKNKMVSPTKTDSLNYNSAATSLNKRGDSKFKTPLLKPKVVSKNK